MYKSLKNSDEENASKRFERHSIIRKYYFVWVKLLRLAAGLPANARFVLPPSSVSKGMRGRWPQYRGKQQIEYVPPPAPTPLPFKAGPNTPLPCSAGRHPTPRSSEAQKASKHFERNPVVRVLVGTWYSFFSCWGDVLASARPLIARFASTTPLPLLRSLCPGPATLKHASNHLERNPLRTTYWRICKFFLVSGLYQ